MVKDSYILGNIKGLYAATVYQSIKQNVKFFSLYIRRQKYFKDVLQTHKSSYLQ